MNNVNKELLEILKKEIKPALGCTGPISIAYAVSLARDVVGGNPKSVKLILDRHTGPGSYVVGIPGTSQLGVEMAAAMGAICGDSKLGLEVLNNVTPEGEMQARKFAKESVDVEIEWDVDSVALYVEAIVETDKGVGRAIVANAHNNVILKEADGKVLFERNDYIIRKNTNDDEKVPILQFKIKDFYEFAKNVPFESIEFLKEAIDLNMKLAESDLKDDSSIGIAKAFSKINGDKAIQKAKTITCAAATARMVGKKLPAMTCATSGNVGISASLPLVAIAEAFEKNEEQLLRGIALSYLLSMYIKHLIGRISTMCACVVGASTGIAAATTFMLNGTLEQVEMAIQNIISITFGVVCDGAKISCALKLANGISSAIECAYLAIDNIVVPASQGVLGKTADESLLFLGKIAIEGMIESDKILRRSMYAKAKSHNL